MNLLCVGIPMLIARVPVAFVVAISALLGIFFVAACVEALLLWLFPGTFVNVRHSDDWESKQW